MFFELQGRLYHAPLHLSNPKRALDLGTGKGAWAIEFGWLYSLTHKKASSNKSELTRIFTHVASKHPDCHVTGVDLQKFGTWKILESFRSNDDGPLPNVTFSTVKSGASWEFDEKFDFIHAQYVFQKEI